MRLGGAVLFSPSTFSVNSMSELFSRPLYNGQGSHVKYLKERISSVLQVAGVMELVPVFTRIMY